MTGSMGNRSNGIYYISKENNQEGSIDMGTVPDFLPGRMSLKDPLSRKYWEEKWNTSLSPDAGLDMVRMIKEAEKGNLKALYIMGENPLRNLPQPKRVRKSLGNLELLIVQDILFTETVEVADVVLPGAAFSEKEGSFTNTEGRIQYFNPVINPLEETKPDWEILDLLISKINKSRRYESLNRIRNEISRLVPMYTDLNNEGSESWVREADHRKIFSVKREDERISFGEVRISNERPSDIYYPFTAILSPIRYHMGGGTRTGFSNRINDLNIKGMVKASPKDIERLDMKKGDMVNITSRYGYIERIIMPDDELREGTIFIPMALENNDVMNMLDLNKPGIKESSGWYSCDVGVKKV
jgi:predicted molibdopterin-dependent oxidoreductase YjgC